MAKKKKVRRYKTQGKAVGNWFASHDVFVWVVVIPTVIAVVGLLVVSMRFGS